LIAFLTRVIRNPPLFLIGLFGFAWRHLGLRTDRKSERGNAVIDMDTLSEFVLTEKNNDDSNWAKLQSIIIELEPFAFSATVFLSGTRFLIDTPEIPEVAERSKQLVKHIFTFERILGAIFTGLFLLAIGRTVIRAA
jgi:hypothetical protein